MNKTPYIRNDPTQRLATALLTQRAYDLLVAMRKVAANTGRELPCSDEVDAVIEEFTKQYGGGA